MIRRLLWDSGCSETQSSFYQSGKTPKFYLQHPNDLNMEMLRVENRGLNKYKEHQRVAPSYLENSIQTWLKEGNVQKLDQLVLSGCGDLLLERTCTNAAIQKFFESLPAYLDDISITHKAVREGDLKLLKDMVAANKKLVLARDRKGATPLHDALLYQQTDVVRFLASAFPHIVNAADYSKRAPLHYAAAARDGGHYYKILEKAGADATLTDKEGKTPVYYRRNPGKLDLRMILERDRDFVPDLPVMMYSEDELASRTESCMSDATLATPARSMDSSERDNDYADAVPVIDVESSDSVAAVTIDGDDVVGGGVDAQRLGGRLGPPPVPSSLSAIFNEDFLLQSQNVLDLSSAINSVGGENVNGGGGRSISPTYGVGADAEEASPKVWTVTQRTSAWPSTENGQFLARTVGVPLTKALAEMVIVRPNDPVQFLADFLFDYDRKMRQVLE